MHTIERTRRRRVEHGATTAEYVGIVAVVALLAIALFALSPATAKSGRHIVATALCKIGQTLGSDSGCDNDMLPHYVPKKCQISANGKEYGGSVSIVATVGADTGYTIYKIRTRQDDGSYKDEYVVKTSGKVNGSYEFGPKAGAEVNTGSSDVDAKGGGSVTVTGDFSTGSNYKFKTLDEAKKFASDNKAKFGVDGLVSGGPDADSTYYELGGKAEVSGDAGPLAGKGSGKAVLGMETFKNGDKKFKLALTAAGAAELGLPVPEKLQVASANGDASVTVQADVTIDKDGKLVSIAGTGSFTVQAAGGLQLGYDKSKGYQPKHAKPGKVEVGKIDLPALGTLQKGASGKFTVDTTLRNPDGTYNSDQAKKLGDGLSDLVTGGTMSPDTKVALEQQWKNNTQVTFNLNDYKKTTDKYGGKVKVLVVTVGAEGHVTTTEENVINGWYYDPVKGTWEQNMACSS